jgi:anti-sigma factor RsiW
MTAPIGPHLGERVSSFVDGALADDARDRALVHVAGCPECHEQVEAARLLKSRLIALPTPELSAGLTARLLAMAEPGGPIPPRPARLPGQPRPVSAPRPVATVPGRPTAARPTASRPAGRRDRENGRGRPRTVRLAALAGAALSTMVVAVVGLSGAVGSDIQPRPVTQLTTNVGGTSDPFVDVSRTLQRVSRSNVLAPTP